MKFSYVAFITNEKYLLGLDTICKSLLLSKTEYPLSVVIPKDSSDEFIDLVKKHLYFSDLISWKFKIKCFFLSAYYNIC